MTRSIRILLLAIAATPLPVAAQVAPRVGILAGATTIRVRDATDGRSLTLSSVIPSGDLFLRIGPGILEGSYAQGRLNSSTNTIASRDFVEGKVLAGVRFLRLFSVKIGPHARSYVLPGGTRRRLFWELRGTFESPLLGELLGTRLDLWGALAGRSNISEQLDHARGGEAALTIQFPRSIFWGKLGYRVERVQMDNGLRADTVEGLIFGLGLRLPKP